MSTTVYLGGRAVSRQEVQRWEIMRGKRALRLLRSHLGSNRTLALASGDIATLEPESLADLRSVLSDLKAGLGPDATRTMLGSRCRRSALAVRAVLALSRGRSKLCTIDVLADGIDAKGYFDWFMHTHESNDEAAMLAANPDHWLIRLTDDGRQEVIETVGHSPLPSHIFITFNDQDGPALPPDPAFPVQLVATARLPDGQVTGRVRHQFRDEGKGLRARLGIEFPWAFPGPVMRRHQWHLACEFSNWIEAAARHTPGVS